MNAVSLILSAIAPAEGDAATSAAQRPCPSEGEGFAIDQAHPPRTASATAPQQDTADGHGPESDGSAEPAAAASDAEGHPDLAGGAWAPDALQDWLAGFNGISAELADAPEPAETLRGRIADAAEMPRVGPADRAPAALAAAESDPQDRFRGYAMVSGAIQDEDATAPAAGHRPALRAEAAIPVPAGRGEAPSGQVLTPVMSSARLANPASESPRPDALEMLTEIAPAAAAGRAPSDRLVTAERAIVSTVLKQVAEAIVISRPGSTELALAPAELGRLRIAITGADTLQIVIWAERPETMELLRRHVDLLQAELLDAGAAPEALIFQDDTPQRDSSDGFQSISRSAGDDPASPSAHLAALALESARLAANRRLDLRL